MSYTVAANTSTSPRTGTLTIAGLTATVTQAGACAYTVAPTTQSVLAAGGSHSAAVTTTSGCGWTGVSNNMTWITVTSGSSGTGNGTVSYTVAANTSTSSRTGTLTIAGQTATVTQAGACPYSCRADDANGLAAGGSQVGDDVTTPSGCGWTAASNDTTWLTVTAGAVGPATGRVSFTVAANTSTSSRTGTLTIAGQTATVTQAGALCLCRRADDAKRAGGGRVAVGAVTTPSGCAWTGVSNNMTGLPSRRQQRDRRRHGDLQRRSQHAAELAHRDADDCGPDGHGHAGRLVHLHRRADHAKRGDGRRVVLGGGHHDERLRLDRREQ